LIGVQVSLGLSMLLWLVAPGYAVLVVFAMEAAVYPVRDERRDLGSQAGLWQTARGPHPS